MLAVQPYGESGRDNQICALFQLAGTSLHSKTKEQLQKRMPCVFSWAVTEMSDFVCSTKGKHIKVLYLHIVRWALTLTKAIVFTSTFFNHSGEFAVV